MAEYKDPFSGRRYSDLRACCAAIERGHPEELARLGVTAKQVVFNVSNRYPIGQKHGKSVISGRPTEWNERAGRYQRFADDRERLEYRKIFLERMQKTYGKDHLLDDPDRQRLMLASRSISGTYQFSDGGKKTYTGKEELALLKFLDEALSWPSQDVHCPAPQNFLYTVPSDGEDVGNGIEVRRLSGEEETRESKRLESAFFPGEPHDDDNQIRYGAFAGGKLVGTTVVRTSPLDLWKDDESLPALKALKPDVWISATAVDTAHRGKGIGKAMRAHLQKEYESILTGSGPKSDPAILHMNKEQGFKPVLNRRGTTVIWHWSRAGAPKVANKKRVYIPDCWLESLNLIIEIKGEMHGGYRTRDIDIEKAKDEVLGTSGYAYVKVEDQHYLDLVDAMAAASARNEKED